MSTQASEIVTPGAHLESLPAYGVWAPPVTPVDEALAPDVPRWLDHLRWLLDNGCHGLALFGTTSEANSFSGRERMEMVEAAVSAGLEPARMVIGTGCCSIPETVELTRHAVGLGCRKVLMLPPFYYKGVSDDGLYDHYSRVIEAVAESSLEVYLYHFPKMSAVPLGPDLVGRLKDAYPDNIAGIKDSSGDWENTHALLRRFPGLAVFPGAESLLLQGLRHGGAGCITATANANPTAIRSVFDAWQSENAEVDALQDGIHATRSVFNEYPAIPALKHVLAHFQRSPGWRHVRPPLVRLSDDKGTQLIEALSTPGYTYPS